MTTLFCPLAISLKKERKIKAEEENCVTNAVPNG